MWLKICLEKVSNVRDKRTKLGLSFCVSLETRGNYDTDTLLLDLCVKNSSIRDKLLCLKKNSCVCKLIHKQAYSMLMVKLNEVENKH